MHAAPLRPPFHSTFWSWTPCQHDAPHLQSCALVPAVKRTSGARVRTPLRDPCLVLLTMHSLLGRARAPGVQDTGGGAQAVMPLGHVQLRAQRRGKGV